jgi:hypothetical protein
MIDQSSASVDAWSRYWRSAQLAACMGGEDGNYAGVVRAAWEQFFRQADNGSIIVDLATGNGAVALIAAAVSEQDGKELEVHGVDLADLAPEIAAKEQLHLLDKIHFHPKTSIESMPFSDRSVAMIKPVWNRILKCAGRPERMRPHPQTQWPFDGDHTQQGFQRDKTNES